MSAGQGHSTGRQIWLRSWRWDLSCLAFCWLPFYFWVVFGLGLGQDAFGGPALTTHAAQAALADRLRAIRRAAG